MDGGGGSWAVEGGGGEAGRSLTAKDDFDQEFQHNIFPSYRRFCIFVLNLYSKVSHLG